MAKKIPIYSRKKYARRRANEFMLQSKITSLPVDPFDVCKREEIIVKSVTEAEECINEVDPFEIRDNPDCDAKTYLTSRGKYVIIYDDSVFSRGRIIWTIAHELGHIILNHLTRFEQTDIQKGLTAAENEVLEKEANAFASEFLAPAEILLRCNCVTKKRIIKLCGLSDEAAEYKEEYLKNYQPDGAFQHNNQLLYQQFYNFINTEGILPGWEIAREHQAKYKTVIHILEKDQDTGRIFTEWQYVLDYIKQNGGFSIYQELKNSVAKIDYDTLFIYSDSPVVQNKLKNSEIADYIMQQVKKSINQPVLEILLLDMDDHGNLIFQE